MHIYIYVHIYTYTYTYIYVYKHKLKTIIPHQWHHTSISGFHYHRQLYCLINRQYRKTWQKTTRLRTTDSLWGETTGDHWNLHPRASKAKCSSCNSSFCRSAYVGKANYTQQGEQMSVLGCHLTSSSTFCSIVHTGKMQENINIPHYWSLMKRIHWWPMDSPHKGPAMQK